VKRALLVLLAGCGAAPALRERPPGGLEPIDPGTTRAALLSARACGACHATQLRAWQASRHALAWTNGIFHREYRDQPRDWCIHCHAPLAPQVAQARAGGGSLADEGVGCAACHVRGGRVVAAERRRGSPHDTLVQPDFGGPRTCANCHEFGFPVIDGDNQVRALTAHPMQATVSQYLAGPYARGEDGCRACHDSHAFAGGHDPAMLRRALDFTVCRDGGDVVMSLANRGAGHSVPTGDVHRHIDVRAWRSAAPEKLYEAFLGRRFTPDDAGGGKVTIWDSTLAPRARQTWRVADRELGDEGPIHFEVRYIYTVDENPGRGRDPGEPTWRVVAERSAPFAELAPCD
jgi:cytochrome c554/c'-like protein